MLPTVDVFVSIERHLATQSEPELMLLKGHLILEQSINQLLRNYFPDLKTLAKMQLTFSRKLDLLKALGHRWHFQGADSEALVYEINRIRNRLAHQLDFDELDAELRCWACAVLGYTPKTIGRRRTYLNTVRRAFSILAAYITGYAEGIEAVQAHTSGGIR